jgi:glycosyltransferase involved in cell wall biosynthesis
MDYPKLSVVMANYNHAHYISSSLKAILSQSFKPDEIIVIDDGSTDNSVEVIKEFVQRYPIVHLLYNGQNRGITFSNDRGLQAASGEYVHFAGADDLILPGFFEESMGMLAEYPQAGICTSLSRLIDSEGRVIGTAKTPQISKIACYLSPEQVKLLMKKEYLFVNGNTCVYKQSAIVELGGIRPELVGFWDGFISHVIALKYGACFIPEPLACFRQTGENFSQRGRYKVEHSLDIIDKSVYMMRSSHKDLFPARFVRQFERQEAKAIGLAIEKKMREDHDISLTRLKFLLARKPTPLARVFLGWLKLWLRIAESVMGLYLKAAYGLGWSSVGRMLGLRRYRH